MSGRLIELEARGADEWDHFFDAVASSTGRHWWQHAWVTAVLVAVVVAFALAMLFGTPHLG